MKYVDRERADDSTPEWKTVQSNIKYKEGSVFKSHREKCHCRISLFTVFPDVFKDVPHAIRILIGQLQRNLGNNGWIGCLTEKIIHDNQLNDRPVWFEVSNASCTGNNMISSEIWC